MRLKPARSRCAVGLAVAVVAVAIAGRAAGYELELTPRGDTVQHVSPSGTGEFHFTLTNTGVQPDVYEFDCRVVAGVPGWAVVYCVRGQCVEPGNLVYDSLPAGLADTAIKVTVYTNITEGEEVVSLRARSMGDSSLAESVATYTIVGAGVEEGVRPGAPGPCFRVTPNPANRQTGASVLFSTQERTSFRMTLHDAVGRLVQTVVGAAVGVGRHSIRWQPERYLPAGVYLLRLSTGAESAVARVIVE